MMYLAVGFAVSYSPSIRRHHGNMTVSATGEKEATHRTLGQFQRVQPMGSLPSSWAAVGPKGRRLGKRGSANPPACWNQPAIPIAMRLCDGRLQASIRATRFSPCKGEVRPRSGLTKRASTRELQMTEKHSERQRMTLTHWRQEAMQ